MKGIKSLRLKQKLTQSELAEKLGVKQTAIAMWETGMNYPRAEMLPLIAKILNCTIDELYAEQSA